MHLWLITALTLFLTEHIIMARHHKVRRGNYIDWDRAPECHGFIGLMGTAACLIMLTAAIVF